MEQEKLNYVPISDLGLPRGVSVWELDLATLTIKKALNVILKGDNGETIQSVELKKGFRYVAAINAKNADRKFVKMMTGGTK